MNDLLIDNLIFNNAYGILGLLSNSTQKEVSKRAKDLEKLLSIDEVPEYDYDFNFYNKLRTLANIKDAQHKLSNPKTQIGQYFFSILINSEKEKQYIDKINKDFSYESIMEYDEAFPKKTFSINKNIAILLTLLQLTAKTNVESTEVLQGKSIYFWSELLFNKKNLRDFEKIYKLNDEIGIDDSVFDNLFDKIRDELITIFSDIAEFRQDNTILANFITTFGMNNSSADIKQVEESYRNIDKSLEILDSMKISDDGIFDEDEKHTLKTKLNNIQTELNNLMDLGLYNDTRTILLRDRIAETVRIQILDLHNNLLERETALNLLNISIKICGTSSLKIKLEDEKEIITKNVISDNHLNPIFNILKEIESRIHCISKYELDEKINLIEVRASEIIANNSLSSKNKVELLDMIALDTKCLAVILHNDKGKFKESQRLIQLAVNLARSPKIVEICQINLNTINHTVQNRCGFANSELGGCLFGLLAGLFRMFGGYIFLALVIIVGGAAVSFPSISIPIVVIIAIVALVKFLNKQDAKL